MSSPDEQQSAISLLRRILKNLSLDWISLILDIGTYLRRFLCSQPDGPYEILNYESTLELLDTGGKKALFKKRQRVQFLQNSVIAFEDYAWGDGEIFSEYRCKPGILVDRYKEGDRWNILISLRATKSIGDITEFHIERTEQNTFTKREEWLQTEIRRRTRRLQMDVIFPRKRQCLRASLVKRSSNKETVLGTEHFHLLPDGRQLVSWETDRVDKYDIYTLKWTW